MNSGIIILPLEIKAGGGNDSMLSETITNK